MLSKVVTKNVANFPQNIKINGLFDLIYKKLNGIQIYNLKK